MHHLIVQGTPTQPHIIQTLQQLCMAQAVEALSDTVWRFHHTPLTQDSAHFVQFSTLCHASGLDCGFVPTLRKPTQFKLLAMDMDSTLIAIECIDEIGDMLGIKPKIAAITESSMRGEIEFAEGLSRRVALLAGLDATLLEQVFIERVRLNPGAEILLARARQLGIKTLLVSGGFTFFTERLQQQLQLDYSAANTLEIVDGRLTGRIVGDILDAQAKANYLQRISSDLNISLTQTIAMGDGANDLLMMACAGVSFAYHAKPVVREKASYAINFNGLDAIFPFIGDDLDQQ